MEIGSYFSTSRLPISALWIHENVSTKCMTQEAFSSWAARDSWPLLLHPHEGACRSSQIPPSPQNIMLASLCSQFLLKPEPSLDCSIAVIRVVYFRNFWVIWIGMMRIGTLKRSLKQLQPGQAVTQLRQDKPDPSKRRHHSNHQVFHWNMATV